MRAKLNRKMSCNLCAIETLPAFFGCSPAMDYVFCCDTQAARKTIQRRKSK